MDRGERRRRTAKIHKKRARYFVAAGGPVALETPQRCSCLGCGNHRMAEGKTRQERRAHDAALAAIEYDLASEQMDSGLWGHDEYEVDRMMAYLDAPGEWVW